MKNKIEQNHPTTYTRLIFQEMTEGELTEVVVTHPDVGKDIFDMVEMIRNVLTGAGYAEGSVEQILVEI